jgi:hypothetical protein
MNMYTHLFGPVPSRRLGMSLGIDLIPKKVCSLNCVYCEVGKTTKLTLDRIDVESWISNNMFVILLLATLIGIIPESGPHLIFVTLFASGTIPFSILLSSSISQDGHGMLPMLAESKKGFWAVKMVNMIFAFIAGEIGLSFGF